jgi:hypothetical protein
MMGDNYRLLKSVLNPISPTCHYNVCLSMAAKRSLWLRSVIQPLLPINLSPLKETERASIINFNPFLTCQGFPISRSTVLLHYTFQLNAAVSRLYFGL